MNEQKKTLLEIVNGKDPAPEEQTEISKKFAERMAWLGLDLTIEDAEHLTAKLVHYLKGKR